MEPMTTQRETLSNKTENHTPKNIVGALFGLAEIILAFRLIFKLLGANSDNGFVKFIYNITQFFVGLFEGIFAKASATDNSVFEPATLIAMIVLAVVAWIILRLMTPRKSNIVERTETTGQTGPDDQQR